MQQGRQAMRIAAPQQLVGILKLLAWFSAFCVVLFLGTAAWRAYDRHVVRSSWPEAEAEILECGVDEYRGFARDAGGPSHSLRCRVRYAAAAQAVEIKSASSQSAALEEAMRRWAAEHPPRGTLRLRYDPQAPESARFADDASFAPDTPEEALITAALFAGGAALALVVARWLEGAARRPPT
jgi:Protein of unknown function (DUF3592)